MESLQAFGVFPGHWRPFHMRKAARLLLAMGMGRQRNGSRGLEEQHFDLVVAEALYITD